MGYLVNSAPECSLKLQFPVQWRKYGLIKHELNLLMSQAVAFNYNKTSKKRD
jgi:hypothetical protein